MKFDLHGNSNPFWTKNSTTATTSFSFVNYNLMKYLIQLHTTLSNWTDWNTVVRVHCTMECCRCWILNWTDAIYMHMHELKSGFWQLWQQSACDDDDDHVFMYEWVYTFTYYDLPNSNANKNILNRAERRKLYCKPTGRQSNWIVVVSLWNEWHLQWCTEFADNEIDPEWILWSYRESPWHTKWWMETL